MRAGREITRRLVLGHHIPFFRISGVAGSNDDPVPGSEARDVGAELFDPADNVGADHMGQCNVAADGAGSHERIVIVRSDRLDFDESVSGSRSRRWDFAVIENLKAAEARHHRCQHAISPEPWIAMAAN